MNKDDILFIWIPKTAGTSMYQIFKQYGCLKLKYPSHYMHFRNQGFITFDHVNVFKLIEHKYVSEKFFKKAFKFAFVRNPWDRLVSFYYSRKIYNIKKYSTFTNFSIALEKKLNQKENFIANILNKSYNAYFHKFQIFHKKNVFFKFNKNINPVGLYNVLGMSQINPQVDWITDKNGNIAVDFLGRFENLESDFAKLSEILGIKGELLKLRQSKHKHYKTYYNEKTKKIVEKLYKKDIELFNYSF